MIKVWIAGSNGQIGRALNDILDPLEIEVLNTDLDDLDITNTRNRKVDRINLVVKLPLLFSFLSRSSAPFPALCSRPSGYNSRYKRPYLG